MGTVGSNILDVKSGWCTANSTRLFPLRISSYMGFCSLAGDFLNFREELFDGIAMVIPFYRSATLMEYRLIQMDLVYVCCRALHRMYPPRLRFPHAQVACYFW